MYENVKTDLNAVTTTIKDDTDNTPNNPDDNKVEDNQEQVLLKIFAADSTGAPLKDGSGNYLTVNEVPEGNNAYYVVLAFKPNETTFSDSTKLTIQSGTVEVKTFDKDATGTTTQTKEDGTQDYVSKTQKVELGKVISVETLDDWKADNSEQYEIKITDKSYEHPTTGAVYENVVTNTDPVTTTIKDNTTDKPNNPSTIENNQENVILKIVAVGENGEPIIKDGKYTFANEVAEGSNAKYMVLAFKPDTTEFKVTDTLNAVGTTTVKVTVVAPATIITHDKTIKLNTPFTDKDILALVDSAIDGFSNDITSEVVIANNGNFKSSVLGTYTITFRVVDSLNQVTTKTAIIKVEETEYLLSANQYLFCEAIDEFNNLLETEKGNVTNLKKLSELKTLSKEIL